MDIQKSRNDNVLKAALSGRLDTDSAPSLDSELKSSLDGITELILDFSELEYISSAGLRVLLSAHNYMEKNGGKMIVKGAGKGILEVFDITGFNGILHIEI